jgi:uncharacterized membrane protein YfcA
MSTLAPLLTDSLPQSDGLALLLGLAAVYAVAAIFSGLSGFGFSAIGSISLLALPPQQGVPLLMGLSLITQGSSLNALWPECRQYFDFRQPGIGLMPYLLGGCCGLPLGVLILTHCGVQPLLLSLGGLLVAYAGWSLVQPARPTGPQPQHWAPRLFVGAIGGVVGGFSAFPGAALVVWNGLTGAGKVQTRATTQIYILFMQILALALLWTSRPASFDRAFWTLLLAAAPAAVMGNRAGVALYRRTGDLGYRRITLVALGLVGSGLLMKGLQ